MINLGLDKYGLQARQRPALLSLFPVFITVAVWAPASYETLASFAGLAVACGLTVAFGYFARTRGLAVEDRLVQEWGGLPTTLWLRHADHHLEDETKQRYYHFLEQNVPGWTAPTAAEEKIDQSKADNRYSSAVRWLLEYTRETKRFPLVFAELVSYGFHRNALGLKPIAIILSLSSVGFSMVRLYGVPLSTLIANQFPQLAVGLISFLIILWWIFGVNKAAVRVAGDAYAKALLGACDAPRT